MFFNEQLQLKPDLKLVEYFPEDPAICTYQHLPCLAREQQDTVMTSHGTGVGGSYLQKYYKNDITSKALAQRTLVHLHKLKIHKK